MSAASFKVFCVKEVVDTEFMLSAQKNLKKEGFKPNWITHEDCFKVDKKERNCIYLFDPFDSDAFNHIRDVGCRILGPHCILESLEFKSGIPKKAQPVFNLAMNNVVVCCTSVDKSMREKLHLLIERMCGTVSRDFTESVTHLVAGEVGSQKYKVAVNVGLQIMSPDWIFKIWETSLTKHVHGTDLQFQEYKCPMFKGLCVTVSGLDHNERNEVKRLIESEGGVYSGEMRQEKCTHLIINKPSGTKYEFAKKWEVNIVKPDWLYDSIEKGFCLDEGKYSVEGDGTASMKTSTPERVGRVSGTRASMLADISCIQPVGNENMSHINETAASNKTSLSDVDATVNNIDLTKLSGDLFLDGCKIYLSGFRGQALEKLRKVINAGGATRLNQLTENVTHVVMGERIDKDVEFLKGSSLRPHIVNAQWLAECYKQGQTVPEDPFLCLELPTDEPDTAQIKGAKKSRSVHQGEKPTQNTTLPNMKTKENPKEDEDDGMDILSQYMQPAPAADDVDGDITRAPDADDTEVHFRNADKQSENKDNDATVLEEEKEDIPDGAIFHGKTFLFCGCEEIQVKELGDCVVEKGGKILSSNSRQIPDYAIVPIDGYEVTRTVRDVYTNVWLQMCLEREEVLTDDNELYSPLVINMDATPLMGCVLSISGFAGTEKDCMKYIAEIMGARVQDYFVRKANKDLEVSTHLVSKEASGSKYTAAKKWNIPVVTKKWIYDCAKTGRKEPEENYALGETTNDIILSEKRVSVGDKKIEDSAMCDAKVVGKIDKFDTSVSDSLKTSLKSHEQNLEHNQAATCSDMNTRSRDSLEVDVLKSVQERKSLETVNNTDKKSYDCDNVEALDIPSQGWDDTDMEGNTVKQTSGNKSSSFEESQKENRHAPENNGLTNTPIPINNRVKALQEAEPSTTPQNNRSSPFTKTPSSGRFLNRSFQPVFDIGDAPDLLDTPAEVRRKRKISLPLEDIFSKQIDEAVKITLNHMPGQNGRIDELDKEDSEPGGEEVNLPLRGVIIAVSKKLSNKQSELNKMVSALGGAYRWTYDSTCTHFIFQGRANDNTKEFRLARDQKKIIVSPSWLEACKEQNCHADESMYPHNYNSNLSLSVIKQETPMRGRRSLRTKSLKSEADTPQISKAAASKKPSESAPPLNDRKDNTNLENDEGGSNLTAKKTRLSGKKQDSEREESNEMEVVAAMPEVSGTLELREILSKQLEDMNSSGQSKKSSRRKSIKKLSASGQINISEDVSTNESDDKGRPASKQGRWSINDGKSPPSERRSSRTNDIPLEVQHSGPEASQSMPITWEDPTGRIEEKKLAQRLEKAYSPTQIADPDLPDGMEGEFSEVEEDSDKMEEEQPVPDLPDIGGKSTESNKKIKTPDAPSLAFPVKNVEKKSPIPINLEDEDKQVNKPVIKKPPVFQLSGISQEEKDDYGALVESLGGQVLESPQFDSKCTHLVIEFPSRNEKFLACVASGKWALHKSYFEACRKENCFVEEEYYEWGGEGTLSLLKNKPSYLQGLAAAAHRWRLRNTEAKKDGESNIGAYHSWQVLLLGDKAKEGSFRRLLEAGGATVLANKPPFSGDLSVSATHAFVDLNKCKMSQNDLEFLLSRDVNCLKPDYIAAYLTDSSASLEDFCPPEIAALQVSMSCESSGKRKASTSSLSSTRSKRARKR